MTSWTDVDWDAEVLDQLEAHGHGRLRSRLTGLTGLTDEEYLWEPVPDRWTVRRHDGRFTTDSAEPTISYTNLEVIHHGAGICLLRDLYLRDAAS